MYGLLPEQKEEEVLVCVRVPVYQSRPTLPAFIVAELDCDVEGSKGG